MSLYLAVSLKLTKHSKQSRITCAANAFAKAVIVAQNIGSKTSFTESYTCNKHPFTINKQRAETMISVINDLDDCHNLSPSELGKINSAFCSEFSIATSVSDMERNKKFIKCPIDPQKLLTSHEILKREIQESPKFPEKRTSFVNIFARDHAPSSYNLQTHKQAKPTCESPTARLKTNLKTITAKKRVLRWILLVSVAFILSWFPYHVTVLVRSILGHELPAPLWRFCYMIGWLNSLFNPICYAYGNTTFKRKFINTFSRKQTQRSCNGTCA